MVIAMPAAFHFVVRFTGRYAGTDTSFLEVSGIASEMGRIVQAEGGENRFVHALPVAVKHESLTLKRGIAEIRSPLVQWCQATLEGGFAKPIEARDVLVYLLDGDGKNLRGWSFSNAFPISWSIDPFKADNSSVAIEKIVLAYAAMTRIM